MPLEIIVVGAGIAGLCAAVSLRRAGHTVKVSNQPQRKIFSTGSMLNAVQNPNRFLLWHAKYQILPQPS